MEVFSFITSSVWLGVLSVSGGLVFVLGIEVCGGRLASIVIIVGEGVAKEWSLLLVFVCVCCGVHGLM